MKNIFNYIIFMFVLCSLFVFSGCNDDSNNDTPPIANVVYEGMYITDDESLISTETDSTTLQSDHNIALTSSKLLTGHGGHKNTIVVEKENDILYTNVNSEVYITIHFDNPKDLEILSFVINDKKYSSYMFEDGSDMENIIIKVNSGNIAEEKEFKIEQIKFVDIDNKIKDAHFKGKSIIKMKVLDEDEFYKDADGYVVIKSSMSFKNYYYDSNNWTSDSKARLYADIDLSSIDEWVPIGTAETPFKGTLDGNGYKISSYTITEPYEYTGLFGYVENAKFVNVSVVDSIISTTIVDKNIYAGGIIAYAKNSTIKNCALFQVNTVRLNASSNMNARIGGLVGLIDNTTIDTCLVTGYISGSSTGELYTSEVAGLVAVAQNNSKILNSYALGTVETDAKCASGNVYKTELNNDWAGGVVSNIDDTVEVTNCYEWGNVTVSTAHYRVLLAYYPDWDNPNGQANVHEEFKKIIIPTKFNSKYDENEKQPEKEIFEFCNNNWNKDVWDTNPTKKPSLKVQKRESGFSNITIDN